MSVVVGTLTIDLKADTASFSKSMDKASQLSARTANDIKRSLEKIATVGLAMGAAVATGTVTIIKGAIDAADAMGKLAQSSGTTAETLSVLSYAAKLSGLQIDQLSVGLVRLSKAAFAAQNGNIQFERVFGRMGVTVADSNGHLKDSGELMQQLAVKFAAMGDGAGKTALATALFGKSGAALIPFLNEYGASQDRVNAAAKRFGLQISSNTAVLAGQAKSNIANMKEQFEGLGFAILSTTLPGLIKLSDQILKVAEDAHLPDLARAFGEKVSTAVTFLGNSLEFAEKHAHGLKIALEAMAAVKVGTIALPVIADLSQGGAANVGKGVDRATLSLLDMQKALPALTTLGSGLVKAGKAAGEGAQGYYTTAKSLSILGTATSGASAGFPKLTAAIKALKGLDVAAMFASMSNALKGLSAASIGASFMTTLKAIPGLLKLIGVAALDAGKALALAALSNPWTIAAAAIIGMGVLLYKFRDSTFSLKGTTYELRDIWKASWIAMGKMVDWLGKEFKEFVGGAKKYWTEFAAWFGGGWIGSAFRKEFGGVLDWARGILGSLVPQFAIDALNEAKRQRLADANKPAAGDGTKVPPPDHRKPPPDTSHMGVPKKDIYGDDIRQLDQAIAQQKAYLAVLDGSPEKIEQVAAAEKARAEILKLNNTLTDAGRPKLTALQQASIAQRIATEESLKALVDYGKELVEQEHSADREIRQTRAMADANLQGAAAVRQATVDNAILGLTYNRTAAELARMAPELAKLRAGLTAKSNIEVVSSSDKDIFNLRQELATRQMLTAATLDSIDAQRQADLGAKLYSLDQEIATTADAGARQALEDKRQAMIDLAQAEKAQADAQAALALRSPLDQYARETDALQHATDALQALQGGTLNYGEQLQIAARQQESFNKATDETVELLLKEGSMGDGVTAFFLKMQEQAKTTAATIFEVLNQTFTKLSDTLTALITAPNHWKRQQVEGQFGTMFEDVGKNLLDNTIKQQMQGGIARMGNAFGINLGGVLGATKPDGSSAAKALWVRMTGGSAGSGGASSAAPASGSSNPFDIFGNLRNRSTVIPSGNELTRLVGVGGGQPSVVGARGIPDISTTPSTTTENELDDLSGVPAAPASRSAAGLGVIPASQQTGTATNVLTSIGKLFGIQPTAKQASSPLPANTTSFLSSPNELNDEYGGTPVVAPSASLAAPNELDVLSSPTSPGSPTAAETAPLQAIPTVLRRSGDASMVFSSPSASTSTASAPPSIQPSTPSSVLTPAGSTVPAASAIEGVNDAIARWNRPSPATAAQDAVSDTVPNAPDVQPKPYTLITRPQPSTLDKVLAAGVNLGGMLGGDMIKYGFAGGGGPIQGPGTGTSDSIPARLSKGEFVIRATPTAKYLPLLQHINSDGAVKQFADGGLVGFGGFDDGAFVSPSAAYAPAETSPSMMASASGAIMSNTSVSSASTTMGDTHTWNIDARGSTDPAQTVAQFDRYMRTAAPKIAAAALHAQKDQQLRRPPSAR